MSRWLMSRWLISRAAGIAALAAGLVGAGAVSASADGTETLGRPSVAIASGTGVVVAGTGLFEPPTLIDVEVPADATITQVLLYWEAGHRVGDRSGDEPDHSIIVGKMNTRGFVTESAEFVAPIIGGPTAFYGDVLSATHRFDLTSRGWVLPGVNTLSVTGLDDDEVADGAGVVVIYTQPGAPATDIFLLDGNDIAFVDFAPPLNATVPQTFTFGASPVARTAALSMMVSSIHDPFPGCDCRPNLLRYTVGGVTTVLSDPFPDTEGREFDSRTFQVAIPAGATTLAVEMVSARDETPSLPASLVWLVAAVAIPQTPAPATVPTTLPAAPAAPIQPAPTAATLAFTGPNSTATHNTLAVGSAITAAGLAFMSLAAWSGRRRAMREAAGDTSLRMKGLQP